MQDRDVAKILSELSPMGADDYIAQVLEVYKRVMEVHEASERAYRSAQQAGSPVGGFSTSTNWR